MEILSNKYSRWYDGLIAKARSRELLTGYVEKHHVLPRSMGGDNSKSNLVTLTYREHFIAHWLLTRFTTGQARHKMLHALHKMSTATGGRVISSWQFAAAKKAKATVMSVVMREQKYWLGRKHTDETRAKMSLSSKLRQTKEELERKSRRMIGDRNPSFGRAKSPRAKAVAADVCRRRNTSPQMRAMVAARNRSPENRAKVAAANLGQKRSPEQCANISAAKLANNAARRAKEALRITGASA